MGLMLKVISAVAIGYLVFILFVLLVFSFNPFNY